MFMARDYELRFNNAAVRSTCPACGASFKPALGEWPFVPDTFEPLCDDCATGSDRTTAAARQQLEAEMAAFEIKMTRIIGQP